MGTRGFNNLQTKLYKKGYILGRDAYWVLLEQYLKKLLDKLFKRCVTNYIYLIDRQGEHLRYC